MGLHSFHPDDDDKAAAGLGAQQREWLTEAIVLVAIALFVTLLFAFSPLDIAAARVFFRPEAVDHWPLAKQPPWSMLYGAAPWITASLVIAGLATLGAGFVYRRGMWRRHGVFLLLTVVLGPGLLVNTVFKDHWDRPRPREIVEFAGPLQYVPAPLPGGESGASFPCGHCSVGFLYGAGWWVWRRHRPRWAWSSLALGLLMGFALGIGRMAAGGHFLSDVLWSGLLALGVCHVLYWYVLRLPAYLPPESAAAPARRATSRWHRATEIAAALGGAGVLTALFATPHGTQLSAVVPLSSLPRPPRVFEVEARTANVEIVLVDTPASHVSIEGELHGFGLPWSRLGTQVRFASAPEPTLRYRIEQHGWFTDLDGVATVHVPAGGLERVVVRLGRGNIRVTDTTRNGVVRKGVLRLQLSTAAGHVQSPTVDKDVE